MITHIFPIINNSYVETRPWMAVVLDQKATPYMSAGLIFDYRPKKILTGSKKKNKWSMTMPICVLDGAFNTINHDSIPEEARKALAMLASGKTPTGANGEEYPDWLFEVTETWSLEMNSFKLAEKEGEIIFGKDFSFIAPNDAKKLPSFEIYVSDVKRVFKEDQVAMIAKIAKSFSRKKFLDDTVLLPIAGAGCETNHGNMILISNIKKTVDAWARRYKLLHAVDLIIEDTIF